MAKRWIPYLLGLLVVMAWAGTLYLAQSWGYGRAKAAGQEKAEEARQTLLCKDALDYRAALVELSLRPPVYSPAFYKEQVRVLAQLPGMLADVERDVTRLCGATGFSEDTQQKLNQLKQIAEADMEEQRQRIRELLRPQQPAR